MQFAQPPLREQVSHKEAQQQPQLGKPLYYYGIVEVSSARNLASSRAWIAAMSTVLHSSMRSDRTTLAAVALAVPSASSSSVHEDSVFFLVAMNTPSRGTIITTHVKNFVRKAIAAHPSPDALASTSWSAQWRKESSQLSSREDFMGMYSRFTSIMSEPSGYFTTTTTPTAPPAPTTASPLAANALVDLSMGHEGHMLVNRAPPLTIRADVNTPPPPVVATRPAVVAVAVAPAIATTHPTHPTAPASTSEAGASSPEAEAPATASAPSTSSDLRAELYLQGFTVIKRGPLVNLEVLEPQLYQTKRPVEPDGPITVNDTEDGRQLYSIRDAQPAYLRSTLEEETKRILGEHNLSGERDRLEMKAIISTPLDGEASTSEQQVHTDDSQPDHEVYAKYYRREGMMLSGVIAIMPGSKLVLYPDGPDGRRVDLELDVGDILVFRGDCSHHGAAYTSKNIRLHFYFTSPRKRRERNMLYPGFY